MNTDGLLRVVVRRRRLVAAALVAVAVAVALPQLAPSPAGGHVVLRAAHDLTAGTVLKAGDVVTASVPESALPSGALPAGEPLEGRAVAGAVRAGEVLTDVRLLGPALLLAQPGDVAAVPVRLADPAAAALLRPGDVVDVLAASTAPDAPPGAEVVAAAVRVLAVPPADQSDEGALVVVAAPAKTAARLAGAAVSSRLSVVVRP